MSQPAWSDVLRWGVAATVSLLFLLSVLAHELAHGLVARSRGMGGGSVTLLFFGGATTQGREATRPIDEAIVAAAGPIASGVITAGFLGLFALGTTIPGAVGEAIAQVSIVLAVLNALLALLNMIPVYPLDGGRVLRAALWRATGSETQATRGVVIVSRVIGWAPDRGRRRGHAHGRHARRRHARDLRLVPERYGALRGAAPRAREPVARDARRERHGARPAGRFPQLTLDTFAAQYLASGEGTSLPVMRDETLLGLIGISQLRRIRQSSWPTMRAADVMVSPPALPTLAPDDELSGALERLRRTGLDGLPVLRGEELLGVLTRRGVVNAIQSRGRGRRPWSAP